MIQFFIRCVLFWNRNECLLWVKHRGAPEVCFLASFFLFFVFLAFFFFTFLLLIKITELSAFLFGFTIFIFKLCFSHFDCIDSLLPSFFSMFVLLCKNMHLEMVSLQYFYNSLVVLCVLCTPTKDYFYARSCVQRELCKHFVYSSITWNCFLNTFKI